MRVAGAVDLAIITAPAAPPAGRMLLYAKSDGMIYMKESSGVETVLEDTSAWTAYTPTWTASTTNPAIGNGAVGGRYQAIGKTIFCNIHLASGTTTTWGSGAYSFSLPFVGITASVMQVGAGVCKIGPSTYFPLNTLITTGASVVQARGPFSLTATSQQSLGSGGVGGSAWVGAQASQLIDLSFVYEAA